MTNKKKYKLWDLKKKNNRILSSYIELNNINFGRKRGLLTFTSSLTCPVEKLLLMNELRGDLKKKLRNLNCNINYFDAIELGQNYKSSPNPHLHMQLFYDEVNEERVTRVFNKILEIYNLKADRCSFTVEDERKPTGTYNYSLKEFLNKNLDDEKILDLDASRKKLNKEAGLKIQYYSMSRLENTNQIYRKLFKEFKLTYENVNALFEQDILRRLYGLEMSREAKDGRENIKCGDSIIQLNFIKLYNLIVFTLLYLCKFSIIRISLRYSNKSEYLFYLGIDNSSFLSLRTFLFSLSRSDIKLFHSRNSL